jgi:hypothetical protein
MEINRASQPTLFISHADQHASLTGLAPPISISIGGGEDQCNYWIRRKQRKCSHRIAAGGDGVHCSDHTEQGMNTIDVPSISLLILFAFFIKFQIQRWIKPDASPRQLRRSMHAAWYCIIS